MGAAAYLVARTRVALTMVSDLVDMFVAPGNAEDAAAAAAAVGHRTVDDVLAVVRDAVPPASRGPHAGYTRVDFAYRQIHWDLAALASLFDAVGARDSSWGVGRYSWRPGENQSGVVAYANDDEMGHRWERAETR